MNQNALSPKLSLCLGPPLVVLLTCLSLLLLPPVAAGKRGQDTHIVLKVAYIYNFTRLIKWPRHNVTAPFVIGVIEAPRIEEGLRVLERQGKRVGERPIEIRPIDIRHSSSARAMKRCAVLFVGERAEAEIPEILERTHGQSTLLLSDSKGFAQRGIAIELFIKYDPFRKKHLLRFRINPRGLRDRGLSVPAQLYEIGEVVS